MWSQLSSLSSPPVVAVNFDRAKGSAISLLVDCSSSVVHSRSLEFSAGHFLHKKKVPTNLYECELGGDSNSRN